MKHYVYKITDPITNEYYIGSRSCKCDIINDVYMGSYVSWKPVDKNRLVKTILKSDFSNRNEANEFEAGIIKENINNELNRNYHIPGIGFANVGCVVVIDEFGKVFNVLKTNEKYISGEFKSIWCGKQHTEETKLKMSKSKKGNPSPNKGKTGIHSKETIERFRQIAINRPAFTEDTRKKISNALKGKLVGDKNPMYGMVGELNPNYGNKWSDTQKKIQSEKLKGKPRSNAVIAKMKIPIIQYDLSGNFIKEWDSLTSAANELKIYVGCINNCLRNRSKSSYGFVWKYKQINNK
jgi:group I intron endonuclease